MSDKHSILTEYSGFSVRNETVVEALSVVLVLYFITQVWHRYQQGKTKAKLCHIGLLNGQDEQRPILLTIATGSFPGSGTKAEVVMKLCGTRGETPYHNLTQFCEMEGRPNPCRRGEICSFVVWTRKIGVPTAVCFQLLATEGRLNSSWYVKYLEIMDYQTLEKTTIPVYCTLQNNEPYIFAVKYSKPHSCFRCFLLNLQNGISKMYVWNCCVLNSHRLGCPSQPFFLSICLLAILASMASASMLPWILHDGITKRIHNMATLWKALQEHGQLNPLGYRLGVHVTVIICVTLLAWVLETVVRCTSECGGYVQSRDQSEFEGTDLEAKKTQDECDSCTNKYDNLPANILITVEDYSDYCTEIQSKVSSTCMKTAPPVQSNEGLATGTNALSQTTSFTCRNLQSDVDSINSETEKCLSNVPIPFLLELVSKKIHRALSGKDSPLSEVERCFVFGPEASFHRLIEDYMKTSCKEDGRLSVTKLASLVVKKAIDCALENFKRREDQQTDYAKKRTMNKLHKHVSNTILSSSVQQFDESSSEANGGIDFTGEHNEDEDVSLLSNKEALDIISKNCIEPPGVSGEERSTLSLASVASDSLKVAIKESVAKCLTTLSHSLIITPEDDASDTYVMQDGVQTGAENSAQPTEKYDENQSYARQQEVRSPRDTSVNNIQWNTSKQAFASMQEKTDEEGLHVAPDEFSSMRETVGCNTLRQPLLSNQSKDPDACRPVTPYEYDEYSLNRWRDTVAGPSVSRQSSSIWSSAVSAPIYRYKPVAKIHDCQEPIFPKEKSEEIKKRVCKRAITKMFYAVARSKQKREVKENLRYKILRAAKQVEFEIQLCNNILNTVVYHLEQRLVKSGQKNTVYLTCDCGLWYQLGCHILDIAPKMENDLHLKDKNINDKILEEILSKACDEVAKDVLTKMFQNLAEATEDTALLTAVDTVTWSTSFDQHTSDEKQPLLISSWNSRNESVKCRSGAGSLLLSGLESVSTGLSGGSYIPRRRVSGRSKYPWLKQKRKISKLKRNKNWNCSLGSLQLSMTATNLFRSDPEGNIQKLHLAGRSFSQKDVDNILLATEKKITNHSPCRVPSAIIYLVYSVLICMLLLCTILTIMFGVTQSDKHSVLWAFFVIVGIALHVSLLEPIKVLAIISCLSLRKIIIK